MHFQLGVSFLKGATICWALNGVRRTVRKRNPFQDKLLQLKFQTEIKQLWTWISKDSEKQNSKRLVGGGAITRLLGVETQRQKNYASMNALNTKENT